MGFHSDAYRRFAAALKAERTRRGLTQRDLASRMGRDHTYITKYETCVRRLDVIEMLEVLEAMGVDPAAFVAELASIPRPA